MKSLYFLPILFTVIFLSGCKKETSSGVPEPKEINLPVKAAAMISQSNQFGIDLFRSVSSGTDENLMLSPLSASTALTMLLNGCQNETYNQIHQMLGYSDMTLYEVNESYQSLVSQLLAADPDVQLALANAVWYRHSFEVKPPYLDAMDKSFDAHIEALDFSTQAALGKINQWANDNTFGKIPKVLNEISPDAVMFLMNALYFKGIWTYPFKENQTTMEPFYPETGNPVTVSTMHGLIPARSYIADNFQAIELTYGRTNFSMVVIMPFNGFSQFVNNFSYGLWDSITSSFNPAIGTNELDVAFPRFKFSYEKILNDQLNALGMTDAFNPLLADLSGISDDDIFVSFVKQNTFVDVNEKGTEAAAVTTIGIDVTSAPGPFMVNKPFIFAIRERTTHTILFIGKVTLPEY